MDRETLTKHLKNACLILYAVLRLINSFYVCTPMQYLSAGILIVVTLFTLPTMKRTAQCVLLALFLVGSALLITSRANLAAWIAAILKNGDLILLLICVPMISGPFYYEDYQSELKHLAQLRMRNMLGFLLLVSVCSHFLAVLLSVGSIIIIYELLSPFGKLYNGDRPLVKTMLRAYCSSGFWSPAWASVLVYSVLPNVLWVRMIPLGILLSALMICVNLGGVYLETKRYPDRYPDIAPDPTVRLNKKRLYTMIALAAAMILSIVAVNSFTGWSLMLSVTVVSLLFPVAAALLQKHVPEYRVQMKSFYQVQLVKVRSQIAVFMMAGFLGAALSVSGVANALIRFLPGWMTAYPQLMVFCIMLLLILPTQVGVHPAATGTALLAAVTPAALGLSDYTFALAVLTGWVFATLVGPFSAVALVLSSYTGENNYAVSVGSNWKYTLVCLVLFSLVICVVGPVMG